MLDFSRASDAAREGLQKSAAMNDGSNENAPFLDFLDNAIAVDEPFSDIRLAHFWDDTARFRVFRDRFSGGDDP